MSDALELFLELAAIASPPAKERAVADLVLDDLRRVDLEPTEDLAAHEIGGTAGNIYVRLDATDPGTAIFLCAHLDTVEPTGELRPTVHNGIIRNVGGTVLGADNKAAVAVILAAVRRVLREDRRHAGLEIVFTVQEEIGLAGARAFDHRRLTARMGYVYDQEAPIGTVILGAPGLRTIRGGFRGRAAHSGFAPEDGRSAIQAGARAIAQMRLGRIDSQTTANIGLVSGGTARNIVPDAFEFIGEVRSRTERQADQVVREMETTCSRVAASAECGFHMTATTNYVSYRHRRRHGALAIAECAIRRCGIEPTFVSSGAGSDANIFNERGLECVNLANGMRNVHTPHEEIAVTDLQEMVEVTLALIDSAVTPPSPPSAAIVR